MKCFKTIIFALLLSGCLENPNFQEVRRIEGRLFYDWGPNSDFKTIDFEIADKDIVTEITELLSRASEFPRGTRIVQSSASIDLWCYDSTEKMVYCPMIQLSSNHGTIISGMSCGNLSVSLGNLKSAELGEYFKVYFSNEYAIEID